MALAQPSSGFGQERAASGSASTKRSAISEEKSLKLREGMQRFQRGKKVASEGKLAEAISEVEKALAIAHEVLGEDHDNVMVSLELLADLYEAKDDFTSAIRARDQVLAIARRRRDVPPWKITDARLALEQSRQIAAWDGNQRSRYSVALRVCSKVEAMYKQGEYKPALDMALRNQRDLGGLVGEHHRAYARCLNTLAELYHYVGDYRRAEPLLRQALEIRRQALGENHPDFAFSLHSFAVLYQEMGDYRRAEPLYQQALEITRRTRGENHPYHATCLNNLAELYSKMGDYRRAEPLYQQALEIKRRTQGENHPRYATSLNNLAVLYLAMGDYRRAEPLLRKAFEIRKRTLGENHPDSATCLDNLAVLYRKMGDYRRAEPLLRKAFEIRKRTLGENHPDSATSLNNLAVLYKDMGDYRRAEPLYRQALEIRKRTRGENHPDSATSLDNLAWLYTDMGDYRRAEPLYRQALEIRKRTLGENHPDIANSLNNLAFISDANGKYQEAERSLAQGNPIAAQWVNDAFSVLGERQWIDLLFRQRCVLFAYLSTANRAGASAQRIYLVLLDWRGGVEAAQAEVRLARDQPELTELHDKLSRTRAQIASLAFSPPSNEGQREARAREIETLRIEKETIERELALRSSGYRQARQPRRLGPLEIVALIPEQTALVDFYEYIHFSPHKEVKGKYELQRRLVPFVLRNGQAIVQVDLGPADLIGNAVMSWRQALGGSPGALDAAARELARLVWEPLRPHVADTKTLLVALDGVLTRFPFGALPGKNPGTYLIEDMTIGYVGSGRALARLLSEPASTPTSLREPSGLLAAGAIDYAADPGYTSPTPVPPAASNSLAERDLVNVGFQALPGTGPEVDRIREAFLHANPSEQAELLTGGAATEGAIKERIGRHRWRYVHLATHGFYESPRRLTAMLRSAHDVNGALFAPINANDPEEQVLGLLPFLRSGLALAGAERVVEEKQTNSVASSLTSDDGLLTAEEVASLDMRGTEMVVLSACETGLGDIATGEGVLGLQRAFHAAGAKSVVASLWKVSDAATSVLMEELYRNLLERKLPKLEALRRAQIFVLRNPQRVRERDEELKRGPGAKPAPLPEGGQIKEVPTRSSPAWWAAFILSGDWR
jgi:CHAT domain-containing protein/tetratricopeptide (TPR) repeat protein